MTRNRLRALAAIAAIAAVVLIALPVLGVDPSASPSSEPSASAAASGSQPASAEPSAAQPSPVAPATSTPGSAATPKPAAAPTASAGTAEPDEDEDGNGKPDKADKKDKTPEHPVTITGIVGQPPGDEGEFTLVVGIKVYKLEAGPKWWWGDANPLAAFVGKSVTVDGEQAEGSDEIDVHAINGKVIRAAGRPPWAGGWKVVGPKHPGWAQWKVDKMAGKVHGRETAPGQQKLESPAP